MTLLPYNSHGSTHASMSAILKSALKDAGISVNASYQEDQLRPALLAFIENLAPVASEVCKGFDQFGLLCALQHLLPRDLLSPQPGFEPDMQILFNDATMLAFPCASPVGDAEKVLTTADYYKFTNNDDRSWLRAYADTILNGIYPVVEAVDSAVKILRWLGKGAHASVDVSADDCMFTELPSAELRERVREYDNRVIRERNVLSRQGFFARAFQGDSPLQVIFVLPNFEEWRTGNLDSAPVANIFDMEGIYAATTLHAEEILRQFDTRVHVEDVFVFLATLLEPLVDDARRGERFAGQGYSFAHKDDVVDYVMHNAPRMYADCWNKVFRDHRPDSLVLESLTQSYWQEVTPRLLDFVSHTLASRESIDYRLFRPKRFVYRCDNGVLFFHLGSVGEFFFQLWDNFRPNGGFADIKGASFEKMLLAVIEALPGFVRIWNTSRKLDFPVEGKVGTDVDVFVRRKQLGFLISCKSYSINSRYELGEGQAHWDRSEAAKSWFRFARKTADAVAAHHAELALPSELEAICPVVCTGWPEYLFEPSSDYYLPGGVPRIATFNEIRLFLENMDDTQAEALLKDPCTAHLR